MNFREFFPICEVLSLKNKKTGKKSAYGRDTFSFDEPVRKKDQRKNGRKRSSSDEEELVGKLSYSDVYVIGKSAKTDLIGDSRLNSRQRAGIQSIEDQINSKKIVGADDFIQYYDLAKKITGKETENPVKEKTSPKKNTGKRSVSSSVKDESAPFVPADHADKTEESCQGNDCKDQTGSADNTDRSSRSRSGRKQEIKSRSRSCQTADSGTTFGKRGGNTGSEPGERGKALGLRVIGGSLRGTKLLYSGDHRVRPMKDRVREAVFNLIGTEAAGRHAVDLFAGTGALAFEAISRGAQSATLIEVHFPTARVTKNNIDLLDQKMPGIKSRIDLITTDVFFFGKIAENIQVRIPSERPWLVFCSPPYDFYVDRQNEMLRLIETFRLCAPRRSMFVIEADSRFNFDLLNVELPSKKRRSYPPAEVAIFYT